MTHAFGRAAPGSVGVEEELYFVDIETAEVVSAFSQVVGEGGAEVKPEVFECLVELATGVLVDADGALAELRRLRAEVAERARPHGVTLVAAGSHPTAPDGPWPIVPLERYERMVAELGPVLKRQLVCGLHVHVSVPDPGTCVKAFEGVVPWLPVLLALSANSPFLDGVDTGLRSARARRLLEMPTGGTPPILRSWDDWAAATRGDNTRRHWDAWPRPEYGTLEVRVLDAQTDVRRAAGFVELVQTLVAAASEAEPADEPYDRDLYRRRRAAAAAGPPDPAEVEALAELIGGVRPRATAVLDGRPEAERQLEVAAAGGLEAVRQDLLARTLE